MKFRNLIVCCIVLLFITGLFAGCMNDPTEETELTSIADDGDDAPASEAAILSAFDQNYPGLLIDSQISTLNPLQIEGYDWLDDCTLTICWYQPTVDGQIDYQLLNFPFSKEGDGFQLNTVSGKKLKKDPTFLELLEYMKKEDRFPLDVKFIDVFSETCNHAPPRIPVNYYILTDCDRNIIFEIVFEHGMDRETNADMYYCNGEEMNCTEDNRILYEAFRLYYIGTCFSPKLSYS